MAASLVVSPMVAAAAVPVGVNLLENPGHEHPGAYFGGRGEINVTWGWVPFWQEPPPGTDLRDQNYRTPEFRPTFARDYPYRVWSGAGSDHWFNYFALNRAAGVMQVVKNLSVGSPIRYTAMTELWSSNVNDPAIPPKSLQDGNMLIRVCIDQDGGPRDLTDPNVICSPWSQPYDQWRQIYVEGAASCRRSWCSYSSMPRFRSSITMHLWTIAALKCCRKPAREASVWEMASSRPARVQPA
ncbi:MAG: hypothetical protein IPO29_02415 [Anaerolineae bacterium]|nr:hypothetical protein [Anaerolineae bacterium]